GAVHSGKVPLPAPRSRRPTLLPAPRSPFQPALPTGLAPNPTPSSAPSADGAWALPRATVLVVERRSRAVRGTATRVALASPLETENPPLTSPVPRRLYRSECEMTFRPSRGDVYSCGTASSSHSRRPWSDSRPSAAARRGGRPPRRRALAQRRSRT